MNLKRMALKGAVILAVVIALCMFFAQTVLTITTPKIKIVTAKRGKLEAKIPLTGELHYPASEPFTLDEAKTLSAVVETVYVREGDEVRKGELLFTSRLLPASDEAVKKAKEELEKAQDAQMKTAADNAKQKVKETGKNKAYRDLTAAQQAVIDLQQTIIVQAQSDGVTLPSDPSTWEGAMGIQGSPKLSTLVVRMVELQQAERDALSRYVAAHASIGSKNEDFQAIKKRDDEQKATDKARADLLELALNMEKIKAVRAPRDGVIAKLDVNPGDMVPGDKAAFTLSIGQPVLKADLAEVRKEVTKDMRVDIKEDWETLKTKVLEIKRESASKKYAIIEITDEMLSYYGGYRGLSDQKPNMSITYHAKSNNSLLPSNAVRTENGQDYVLVIEDQNSFWGQEKKVRKLDVHVAERSDTQCAVEDELSFMSIANGEDRPIKDGDRVMEYLS